MCHGCKEIIRTSEDYVATSHRPTQFKQEIQVRYAKWTKPSKIFSLIIGNIQNRRLCDPIEQLVDSPLDVANLFENLASNFAGVVQYNKDNSPHATITIDDVCDTMNNQTIGAQIDRLAAVNDLLLTHDNQTCLDYKYDKMVAEMRNASWESDMASGSE